TLFCAPRRVLISRYPDPRALRSFPTRRSSDLDDSPVRRNHPAFHIGWDEVAETTTVTPTAGAAPPAEPSSVVSLPLGVAAGLLRSEEHTSELQSRENLVCRLLLEKKKKTNIPC